jgi:CBS domain-containing protein
MLARDVMSRDVVTVTRDTTVQEVARLLTEHGISGVPVVDEGRRVVGIVSEGDLIYQDKKLHKPAFIEILGGVIYLENPQRLGEELMKMTAFKVGQIMTAKVHTVREDTPVQEIASLMVKYRINRVPVLDGQRRLAGIVSRQDIVRSLL